MSKEFIPFLTHSEITSEIYIVYGKGKKACVTEQVVKAMKETDRLKQTNTAEWILCKDRLPSNNEPFDVLCCDKYGELLIAHPFEDESSNTGYSAESDDCYMYDAVAWCIIQPYKAVAE